MAQCFCLYAVVLMTWQVGDAVTFTCDSYRAIYGNDDVSVSGVTQQSVCENYCLGYSWCR